MLIEADAVELVGTEYHYSLDMQFVGQTHILRVDADGLITDEDWTKTKEILLPEMPPPKLHLYLADGFVTLGNRKYSVTKTETMILTALLPILIQDELISLIKMIKC